MPKFEPPQDLPARILNDAEMIKACYERDFSRIFKIMKRAGLYPALIARRCDLTPSRVGEVIQGQRIIKDMAVVERVADGLRIPGHMLGLVRRGWEDSRDGPVDAVLVTPPDPGVSLKPTGDLWVVMSGEELADPEFTVALIESQLLQRYKSANYFGARQSLATVNHDVKSIARLLETTNGPVRRRLLHVGSQTAEFLGWLYQDLGDFTAAAYWSDRSMEWAQEATDHHMQSYLLFRKSHQAAAQGSPARAVGLAQAAQHVPSRTPQLSALAALQEAAGHALQGAPQVALTKFDEAHELASRTCEAHGHPRHVLLHPDVRGDPARQLLDRSRRSLARHSALRGGDRSPPPGLPERPQRLPRTARPRLRQGR
ncbi:hypothetical protein [Streptomyces sp. NPDC059788]|uniref:hypothetical protein n=1 Tax=Streptomyces sp. NPDC059788 TaxID=3346948 RepID=UPI00366709D8